MKTTRPGSLRLHLVFVLAVAAALTAALLTSGCGGGTEPDAEPQQQLPRPPCRASQPGICT